MLEHADIFNRIESEVRSYCRHFPAVFASAKGSWLTAVDGRQYLDLLSGAGSLNYGHNNPAIMERIIEYVRADGIIHSLDLHTAAKARFLEVFDQTILGPRNLHYKVQFPGPTGTNAVEAALKLARKATGRSRVVAFTGAFHGMTLGALAASSNPAARNGAGTSLNEIIFMPYDGFLGPACNTMNYVEAMLGRAGSGIDRPAAAIIENVQGEGGLSTASAEWVRQLASLCKDLGMLLIVDDIQAGCGRTGRFFSFEEFGIVPDIVVLSKSLSGFGTPLSVVLMRPELDIWRPGEHNGTFRGNNLAFVGATAAMENYWTNDDFPQAIKVRSDLVRRHLSKIAMDLPAGAAKVNGCGLLIGLEFSDHGMAGMVSRRLFEDGIIVETCGAYGQVLKLLPPLTITIKDLEFCLGAIANAVGDAHKETSGTPS